MFWTVNPPKENGTYKRYDLDTKEIKEIYVIADDYGMDIKDVLWWGPIDATEPNIYREKSTGMLYDYYDGGLESTIHEGLWMLVDPIDLELEFEKV